MGEKLFIMPTMIVCIIIISEKQKVLGFDRS